MVSEAELDAMRRDNLRASQEAEDMAHDARRRDAERGQTRAEEEVEDAKASIARKFTEQVLGDDVDEELPQDD